MGVALTISLPRAPERQHIHTKLSISCCCLFYCFVFVPPLAAIRFQTKATQRPAFCPVKLAAAAIQCLFSPRRNYFAWELRPNYYHKCRKKSETIMTKNMGTKNNNNLSSFGAGCII